MINRFTALRSCLQPVSIRHFSRGCSPVHFKYTSTNLEKGQTTKKPNLKHDQDVQEVEEQKKFDKNQEKLERMEHDSTYKDLKQPNCDKLKKIGDDARIEQNRPDDGVY
ncbi:hypothetical protein MOSE0_E04060 [Monosporozyma servazzii]